MSCLLSVCRFPRQWVETILHQFSDVGMFGCLAGECRSLSEHMPLDSMSGRVGNTTNVYPRSGQAPETKRCGRRPENLNIVMWMTTCLSRSVRERSAPAVNIKIKGRGMPAHHCQVVQDCFHLPLGKFMIVRISMDAGSTSRIEGIATRLPSLSVRSSIATMKVR